MSDAERIAARMRENSLSIIDYLAETIELKHEPPSPMDGLVKSSMLSAAMRGAAQDTSTHRENTDITAEGDVIIQRSIVTTTGKDQKPRTVMHTARYTIANGQVVALYSSYALSESDTP
jgi:hypothetical protein